MVNETIDYEQLVKAKYPDAKNDSADHTDDSIGYWVEIDSIDFVSIEYMNCGLYYLWAHVYFELKSQNLI